MKAFFITRALILFSGIVSMVLTAYTQPVITGVVKTKSGLFITGASVQLKMTGNKQVTSFAITNTSGQFSLTTPVSKDSCYIEVTHLLYEKKVQYIEQGKSDYALILSPADIPNLPEVTVKTLPIQRNGDTMKYRVSAFAGANDRVIGDVINKIPGLEINANGQISYQGRPINRYYIEGLDLLGNQYNMANESIRLALVEQVEVWERHQSIKVLDSITGRNEVALNLKLSAKGKQKWSGQVMTATGLPQPMGALEANAMKFVQQLQTLNAIKTNNTGHNVTKELNELTLDAGDWEKTYAQMRNTPVLSIPRPTFDFLKEERRLFNETIMPYINMLKVSKPGVKWRINIQASYDKRRNELGNERAFFLPADTVKVNEYQNWSQRQSGITAFIQAEDNKPGYYTRHSLRIQYNTLRQNTWLTGSFPSRQQSDNPFWNIKYSLSTVNKDRRGRYLLRAESNTDYFHARSALSVFPGVFETVLNASQPLNFIRQQVPVQTFGNNSKLVLQRLKGKWLWQWFVKTKLEWTNIYSTLVKDSGNIQVKLPSPYANDYQFRIFSLQTGIALTKPFGKNELQLEVPAGVQLIQKNDNTNRITTRQSIPLFLPSVTIQRRWGNYSFRIHSRLDIRPVNWQENFSGFIATDYRTLTAYTDQFLIQHTWSNGFGANFNNPLKGLSAYASIVYIRTLRNLLPADQFNGIFVNQTYLEERNIQRYITILAGSGKYIARWKGGLQWNIQLNQFQTPGIQNSKRFSFANQMLNTRLKLFTRVIPFLHLETNTEISVQRIRSNTGGYNRPAALWMQQAQGTAILVKNKLFMNLSGEWGSTNQNGTANHFRFINAALSYKRKKTEWQLVGTNLLNTRSFVLPSTNLNYTESSYIRLRPLNILVKATWIL